MARNAEILNHWTGLSARDARIKRREFEKFYAQILDRVRWIAGHKKRVVAPESLDPAPRMLPWI